MRAARSKSVLLLRTIFAVVATLAFLSSAVPLGVLSAAHSCSMPCCTGEAGTCGTGACGGALFKASAQVEEEKLCGAEGGHEARRAPTQKSRATNSAKLSASGYDNARGRKTVAVVRVTARAEKSTRATLSATVLAAPCPKDCCAGAGSSAQSKRWRESDVASAATGARPSNLISLSRYAQSLPPASRSFLKRLRPRGPPFIIHTVLA